MEDIETNCHLNFSSFTHTKAESDKILSVLKKFCMHFKISEKIVKYEQVIDYDIIKIRTIVYCDASFKKRSEDFLKENLWSKDYIPFYYDVYKADIKLDMFNFYHYNEFKKTKQQKYEELINHC